MKIWHYTFDKDGASVIGRTLLTHWNANAEKNMRCFERRMTRANPKCVFRISVEFEDSDAPDFSNVEPWKVEIAANLMREAQQEGIARKLGQSLR